MIEKIKHIVFISLFLLISSSAFSEELNILAWEGYVPQKHIQKFQNHIKAKYDTNITIKVKYLTQFSEIFDGLRAGRCDLTVPTNDLIKDKRYNFIENK